MSTTATAVINGAFDTLQVKDPTEALSAVDAQEGLRRLNNMVLAWSLEPQAIPFTARQVFSTTTGKGGPSNPYTIGPGGDFNTTRPDRIEAAALLLTTSNPAVEIPISILSDDAWEAQTVKELQSSQWTSLYYQRAFAGGLGSIQLWPVPNNSTYQLVLYRGEQMTGFVDLTTSYDLPPGYEEAYEYNLALRLAAPYAKAVPPDVAQFAALSLALVRRSNMVLTDLANDFILRTTPGRPYNILSDS